MDLSTLTSLISAFRAETREDSITPESLGALLQRIVNEFASSANSGQSQSSSDWTWCKNQIQQINGQINTLQTNLTATTQTAHRANTLALDAGNNVQTLDGKVKQLEARLNSIGTSTGGNNGSTPTITIEHKNFIALQAIEGSLFVRGNLAYLREQGLVPYIFRYTVKEHRVNGPDGTRIKGPKKTGWHVFYGTSKILTDTTGLVQILSEREGTKGQYFSDPEFLFEAPTFHEDGNGNVARITVPYGKYNYDVHYKSKRFRFAIAYGLPAAEGNFSMHLLRTNLASIKVKVYQESTTDQVKYKWSR